MSLHSAPWTEERVRTDAELNCLLRGCAVLCEVVHRAVRREPLGHQELVVLRHSLGHLDDGAALFNFLLRRSGSANHQMRMGRSLRDNPASCARIRKRLPELSWAVGCDCNFSACSASYPHPLLHLERGSSGRLRVVQEGPASAAGGEGS